MSGFGTRCRSIVFRLGIGVLAASALALAGGATKAPSAANGLVAAYAFDEGAGPSVADASGNGNRGTISGAWWTSSGHQGGGLAFDGIDDLVTVADAASLDLTAGMTLEAWVKPDALGTPATAAVIKERSGGGLVYGLHARSGTQGPGAAVHNGVAETRAQVLLQVPSGARGGVQSEDAETVMSPARRIAPQKRAALRLGRRGGS